MEKAEAINEFFPSVFSEVVRLPTSLKSLILQVGVGRRKVPPTISKEQVQDHLMKLHSHKSIELDGIHEDTG